MQLKNLQSLVGSKGDIQWAIVYYKDGNKQVGICSSIEYAMKHHGDKVVESISSTYKNGKDCLVFHLL